MGLYLGLIRTSFASHYESITFFILIVPAARPALQTALSYIVSSLVALSSTLEPSGNLLLPFLILPVGRYERSRRNKTLRRARQGRDGSALVGNMYFWVRLIVVTRGLEKSYRFLPVILAPSG